MDSQTIPRKYRPDTLFSLPKLIAFRHWMHQNAELSLLEFKTHTKIVEYLTQTLNIPLPLIKPCVKTGITLDLYGTGPPNPTLGPLLIAIRADIDALPLYELNNLPYKSPTQVSHMCGHDGHTTILLGAVSLILDHLDQIPSNRGVRFLFQPGEEGSRGAQLMVNEGAMIGVGEVYGLHNMPVNKLAGKIGCVADWMMASSSKIDIKVVGKGGHGSLPGACKNPVKPACEVYLELDKIVKSYAADPKHKDLRCSIPVLKGSDYGTVIPDTAAITGTIRNFDYEEAQELMKLIENKASEVMAQKYPEFGLEMKNLVQIYPAVRNTKKETDWVKRAVTEYTGNSDVNTEECCPVLASEDFSYFLKEAPGCFFFAFIGGNKEGVTLHSSEYLFDDSVVENVSWLWWSLVKLRLNND